MWSKLQIRMMSLIPGFTRSSLACQRKFNALIKQHKKDVLDLKEFGRDHHSYKFYDLLDRWWHTNGTVMKHVTANLHESESLGNHLEYMEDAAEKFIGEEDDEEGEESKKNWADSEVETLIVLRREMDAEFVKNWKKQGTCFRSLQIFYARYTLKILKAIFCPFATALTGGICIR